MSPPRRILHCLRTPAGGLFRHVHDLARGQANLGHKVGVVCDRITGNREIERALNRLADNCALGVTALPMPRQVGFGDWLCARKIGKLAARLGVDVVHGHGPKGGAYARLAARRLISPNGIKVAAIYTPQAGSLQLSPTTLSGRFYLQAERKLAALSDGIIFESLFTARRYSELIGPPPCPLVIVPNGLYPHEIYEATLSEDAVDFVFIGELRRLQGADVMLAALAAQRSIYPATALIVGTGPDEKDLKRLAHKLELDDKVTFAGALPARTAFARGRCVVVPSRAEELPYVVMEAAAAQMPLIATETGGIPEIVAGTNMQLIRPGDIGALAGQMRAFLANPKPFLGRAIQLQKHVAKTFTVERMTNEVLAFYDAVLGKKAPMEIEVKRTP